MTKIDFYILPGNSIEHRHLFACRLADKAFKLGNEIYIHSDDNAQAHTLDKLLWSWRNSSFLPHQLVDQQPNNEQREKIQIGYGDNPTTSINGLLINLSHSVPEFFSRFERVSEVVVQLPNITEATRSNYRFYRDRGYQLENHDLRK
jgi:DNA polymerase-3 subunit chi